MKLIEASVESKLINRIYTGITLSYVVLVFLFLIYIKFEIPRGILLIASIGIHLLRHKLKEKDKLGSLFLILLTSIEFILLILAFMDTGTEIENTLFLLFTADIILRYNFWFSISFAYVGYLLYLFLWTPPGYDITFVLMSILNQSILIVPIWSAKVLLNQKDKILKLNKKIVEQSAEIEDLAKLKERNRIAEEVHDTVGHTLTTAIVALEGAHLLFKTKPDEAHKKMNLAKQQLKIGLGDIRSVVKKLKSDENGYVDTSLEESIKEIIKNIENQTHLLITMDYHIKVQLISLQQHVMIRSIQEGITNSIKHGKSTRIHLRLESDDQEISLSMIDNGISSKPVELGFGLTSMKNRVEALGGMLHYEQGRNGFVLLINLPILKDD